MNGTQVLQTVTLAAAILLSTLAPAPAAPGTAAPAAAATSAPAARAQTDVQPSVHGSQPFLVILCRFAGSSVEIEQPAFFTNLLFGPAPALDDYWREVSAGAIDLAGSDVTGWYGLPKSGREYMKADGTADIAGVAADCVARAVGQGAAQSAAGRDLKAYAGFVTVYNQDLETRPWAGELCAGEPGARQCSQIIWMWPAWVHNLAAWAHEMGHVFGLPHSSDASGAPYANPWDVMSGFASCETPQYPIAEQLDQLGWIAGARRLVVTADGATTADLQPLANRGAGGYLLVQIPTGASGHFYTVEARARLGYDEDIPAAAVLIHRVDTGDADHPAHLVTHPGGPLTAAAGIWRPGEVFTDSAKGLSISVDATARSGYRITIRRGSAAVLARPALRTAGLQLTAARSGNQAASFGGAAASEWAAGAPLLGLAAGALGSVVVVSAKTTSTGMSPAIQAAAWEEGTWQAPQTLSSGWSSMPGDAPAIAVSRENAAFLAWSGAARPFPTMTSAPVNADIWLSGRPAGGGWDAPARLNDDTVPAMQLSPAIAAGAGGRLYAAWEDQREGNRDIYFAELAAGKPVGANRRLNDDTGGEASQLSPTIAADGNGNVQVLWVDQRSGSNEIYAAQKSASGAWSSNIRLAAAGLDIYGSPSVTVDGWGNAYAAWVAYPACGRANGETGTMQAAFRPVGGQWQPAETVAAAVSGGKESRPVIAADETGNVYLAWEERQGTGIVIRLSHRTPTTRWSAGEVAATTEAAAPSKPALAVDASGSVYLAWLTKNGNAERLALAERAQ